VSRGNEEVTEVTRLSWDDYFSAVCKVIASRADCRRAQVGAVIVKDHRIVATGYNGSPAGGASCVDGECPRGLLSEEELASLTPDYSNCIALHSEMNAIAYASRSETEGATIYLSMDPCDMCNKLIRAAGITRVVVG
jgi:dCMP deaminase